jgi:hypothetical protein
MNCQCCGESHTLALTTDHVNGKGKQHLRENKIIGGGAFYRWLINNNFPEGYRVWCFNCNCSRGRAMTDYCPLHQSKS